MRELQDKVDEKCEVRSSGTNRIALRCGAAFENLNEINGGSFPRTLTYAIDLKPLLHYYRAHHVLRKKHGVNIC